MERKVSKIKFVGLHAHSVAGSIFDAIGYPGEHADFAYANGCDALALTDQARSSSQSLVARLTSFHLLKSGMKSTPRLWKIRSAPVPSRKMRLPALP
jgi:hypothetical protein